MTEFSVKGRTLKVGKNELQFESPIEEYIKFGNFIVVRLKLTGDESSDMHQNVIAINSDGSIRWRIEKAPEEDYYDAYAGIFEDEGELRAYNLSGINYRVNKDTGEVTDGKFVK